MPVHLLPLDIIAMTNIPLFLSKMGYDMQDLESLTGPSLSKKNQR